LDAVNYYWPRDEQNVPLLPKAPSEFAGSLRDHENTSMNKTIAAFLQRALQNNQNVILSSEEFDALPLDSFETLKHMLQGFDVTVVFVYREWLSHLISLHFQVNRFIVNKASSDRTSKPFSVYLLRNMDRMPAILQALSLVDTFVGLFGRENVTIIDLAGTRAAHVPIEKVVVCEIMKVLCDKPQLFGTQTVRNTHSDLIPVQIYSLFRAYVELKNNGKCNLCRGAGKVFDQLNEVYTATLSNEAMGRRRDSEHLQQRLPKISSHLKVLVAHGAKLDEEFRYHYKDRILYGNHTANYLEMMNSVFVEELDIQAFMKDKHWIDWMEQQFAVAYKAGLMCNCYAWGFF
jgi:hypothetical protein